MSWRSLARVALIGLSLLMVAAASAVGASAHGAGDTSNKAADYVRQCLAYMENLPGSMAAMDMAEDKMHDAMDAPDTMGVDMQDVAEAHTEYHNGDMSMTVAYLEAAIGVQPGVGDIPAANVPMNMQPVTGAQPGNAFIATPLDGVRSFSGVNLWALVASIAALVCGAVLALRSRLRRARER